MSFQIGDSVGDYKIAGVIGSGASGEVFRVEHNVTRRVEAMKVLVDGRSSEAAQQFLREIKLHASLNHPNIASVYNAFWVKDDLVMVMELVDGYSLQGVLDRRRLSIDEAIDYTCQALSALSYAHATGVVHRDIKPANMIVTRDGTLKVTDFGIAKTAADPQASQNGGILGSLYYMSPEQVRNSAQVDSRSDIYSLGAVLYEMATGRKPFDSGNSFQVMLAHVEHAPRPPVECSPALQDAILTALAKKPSERFHNADRFREALEEARNSVAVQPSFPIVVADQPGSIVRRAKRQHFSLRAAIPLALAIVVLVLAIASWRPRLASLMEKLKPAQKATQVTPVAPEYRPPDPQPPLQVEHVPMTSARDPLKEFAALPPPPMPRDAQRRSAPAKAAVKPNPFPQTVFTPPPARKDATKPIPEPPAMYRSTPDVPIGVPGERAGQVIRSRPPSDPWREPSPVVEAKKTRGRLRKAFGRILKPFGLDDEEPPTVEQSKPQTARP